MFASLARNDTYLTTSKEQRIAIRKERQARLNRSPEVQLREMYVEAPSMTDPPKIEFEEVIEPARPRLTFTEAKELLDQRYPSSFNSVIRVQHAVLSFYPDVTFNDLLSARKSARLVEARQIAMYICKIVTRKSFPEIGRRFGRDHTTVLHGIRRIRERMDEDDDFAFHIAWVEAEFDNRDIEYWRIQAVHREQESSAPQEASLSAAES